VDTVRATPEIGGGGIDCGCSSGCTPVLEASILGRRVRPANPRLFVVGCPRSGTTLLQRMLNSHPQPAVASYTHFIPAAIRGSHPHRGRGAGVRPLSRLPGDT